MCHVRRTLNARQHFFLHLRQYCALEVYSEPFFEDVTQHNCLIEVGCSRKADATKKRLPRIQTNMLHSTIAIHVRLDGVCFAVGLGRYYWAFQNVTCKEMIQTA